MIHVCIVIEPAHRSIPSIRELFSNRVVDLTILSREELLTRSKEAPVPDLIIICDETASAAQKALQTIAGRAAFATTPIWVATSHTDRDFCDTCYTLGVSDILQFPLLQSELQAKLISLINTHAHHQIEHQLKVREATLREALDTGKMAHWEIDVRSKICTFNDTFFHLHHTSVAMVGGYQIPVQEFANRFVHPDDRHLLLNQENGNRTAPTLKQFHEFSYRVLYGDGSRGTMHVRYHLRSENGVLKAQGICRDITEETERERLTRDYKRRLEATQAGIDAANFGIYQVNNSGYIRYANDHALRMTGFSRDQLLSMHITELDAQLDLETWKRHRKQTLQKGGRMIETQHRCKDGSLIDVEVTVHPFLHEGKFSSFSFVRDLTESKKVEQEKERAFQAMLEAKESAERANRSKDEFLAVMSHEMRTPLNPILGFANILRKECTAEQNEYISIIYESAERLRNLISEILDYIRLGKGDIEPKLAEFDLLELCQTSFLDARQQFEGKPIQLSFINGFAEHAPISRDYFVRSDSHMILRILDNLLINACKYTPSGSVHFHVGCDVRAEEPSQTQFFASVVDTGIGIGPEALQNIFDPFTQADSSYSRKSEGVGLGLSICKKLIDLLGGAIAVESQPGKGSTFRVQIPLEPIKNNTTRPRHADPVEWKALPGNPNILIVDDTANNAKIASIMVRKVGCRSESVCDGHAAISRCAEQAFDLILMDLSMPGMDGMETTRRLRQTPGPNQNIPIVGLSAHVSHTVRQQCTDAGMNGYLEKPIQAEELQETLWKHLAASP
ncbi:MAG: response regulator [Puniceicoccaceae bacterium]